jgi:hypothetical protein
MGSNHDSQLESWDWIGDAPNSAAARCAVDTSGEHQRSMRACQKPRAMQHKQTLQERGVHVETKTPLLSVKLGSKDARSVARERSSAYEITVLSSALRPFHKIWTPMQTRMNEERRMMTFMADSPSARPKPSANR